LKFLRLVNIFSLFLRVKYYGQRFFRGNIATVSSRKMEFTSKQKFARNGTARLYRSVVRWCIKYIWIYIGHQLLPSQSPPPPSFPTVSSKPCKSSCKFFFRGITSTHSQIRLPSYCGIKSHFHVICDSLTADTRIYASDTGDQIVYINFISLYKKYGIFSRVVAYVFIIYRFSFNYEITFL